MYAGYICDTVVKEALIMKFNSAVMQNNTQKQ